MANLADDHKEDRRLNIATQAKKLDPNGKYVRKWLPELEVLPTEKIHCPIEVSPEELTDLNFKIGVDYPRPMVRL